MAKKFCDDDDVYYTESVSDYQDRKRNKFSAKEQYRNARKTRTNETWGILDADEPNESFK